MTENRNPSTAAGSFRDRAVFFFIGAVAACAATILSAFFFLEERWQADIINEVRAAEARFGVGVPSAGNWYSRDEVDEHLRNVRGSIPNVAEELGAYLTEEEVTRRIEDLRGDIRDAHYRKPEVGEFVRAEISEAMTRGLGGTATLGEVDAKITRLTRVMEEAINRRDGADSRLFDLANAMVNYQP